MKYYLLPIYFACILTVGSFSSVLAADENIFGDYAKDLNKEAEAKSTNVYNAWGDNMANMIEKGARDGVVINGSGSYAGGKIKSDGLGNIAIERGANVGPVINKTTIKDSTVIFRGKQ